MLVPVSRDILLETVELRLQHPVRLNLPDAIHLASAVKAGCSHFVTSDKGIRPPSLLERVPPNAQGLSAIIGGGQ